jgi:hypothetical protein
MFIEYCIDEIESNKKVVLFCEKWYRIQFVVLVRGEVDKKLKTKK